MLNVNKIELNQKFKEQDWNYVFTALYSVCDFLLSTKYNAIGIDDNDIKQECAENFYKKVLQNKVDENRNIFSFIWKNSTFRILEILRKHNNRRKKAIFVPFDSVNIFQEKPEYFLEEND